MINFIDIKLEHYLILSAILFCIGIFGIITSRNIVRVLMSIELILNAVNINLVSFSHYITPTTLKGQIFAIFVMCVAAAEAGVGLAIVISVYRNFKTINIDNINLLKW